MCYGPWGPKRVGHDLVTKQQTHIEVGIIEKFRYSKYKYYRSYYFVESSELVLRACLLSHVQLFATPWTVARQVPLSMGLARQEY